MLKKVKSLFFDARKLLQFVWETKAKRAAR